MRASRRFWRQPIHTNAAPSSAHEADVQLPLNANGTASVRNATPSTRNASTSGRCAGRPERCSDHANVRYTALTASELNARGSSC